MAILAQESPTFQPAMRVIASITNARPLVVTTTFDHDYITGEIVRLKVPNGFGMRQANNFKGAITVTGADTFTMDLDSTNFDAYAIPAEQPGHFFTQGQVVPVGEVNNTLAAASRNVLRTPR